MSSAERVRRSHGGRNASKRGPAVIVRTISLFPTEDGRQGRRLRWQTTAAVAVLDAVSFTQRFTGTGRLDAPTPIMSTSVTS
ncbi:hypothetical protein BaRGS_00028990, partial [Batillaria attramentaria]